MRRRGSIRRADGVDWLVVTAANPAQARGYRAQLEARQRAGRLGGVERWMVVPDAGGKRIGSGASTILVLRALAQKLAQKGGKPRSVADVFRGQRIVVLHSGGDSRRLPAYAAQGKIFAPIPMTGGNTRPLFDLVLEDIAGLRTPSEGRVVIAAGDLFLDAAASDPDLSAPGVVGVASRESLERASRHGVFVFDDASPERVSRFLQKPSHARMREAGAVDRGGAWVDTGVVSLDPESAGRLLGAGGFALRNREIVARSRLAKAIEKGACPQIDLYVHVLAALPQRTTLAVYLQELASVFGTLDAASHSAAVELYEGLQGVPFHAARLAACAFLHVGSTREMLDVHKAGSRQTFVDGNTAPGSTLQGRNLIVGEFRDAGKIVLGKGLGLVALPIGKDRFCVVGFHERDDFKSALGQGGTAFGAPLAELAGRGARWPKDARCTFWDARVWRVGTLKESADHALRVMRGERVSTRCVSIADVLARVDHRGLLQHAGELRAGNRPLLRLVDEDPDLGATEIVEHATRAGDLSRLDESIARGLSRHLGTLRDARLLKLAATMEERKPGAAARVRRKAGQDLDDAACDAVSKAIVAAGALDDQPGKLVVPVGGVVRARCGVRIDLAGGWSDTPPICHERGGAVVNASILLDDGRPLRAEARVIDEPVIELRSVDLGGRMKLTTTRDVFDHRREGDWSALAKAACVVSGIAPPLAKIPLADWLGKMGGGISLEFESAVPKGSGLGTSSALGATMLAALEALRGRRGSVGGMLARATLLEQMMGTGGGWQDQAGAALGGARILRTRPGMVQIPRAESLPLHLGQGSELEGRVLLYYTGMQRLAKDILRQIVLRYLSRDRHTLRIVDRLKAGAERAAAALRAGEIERFARAVDEYWWLKRSIDPGASNAGIEAIQERVRGLLSACVMPGAGGGGFLFMIARDADAAALVRKRLESEPPNAKAGFHGCAVDAEGLRVEIERA